MAFAQKDNMRLEELRQISDHEWEIPQSQRADMRVPVRLFATSELLEQIVDEAETFVAESTDRERPSTELGGMVMNRLKKLDKVAYVRFASVYLDFKDVREFMDELKDLLKAKGK